MKKILIFFFLALAISSYGTGIKKIAGLWIQTIHEQFGINIPVKSIIFVDDSNAFYKTTVQVFGIGDSMTTVFASHHYVKLNGGAGSYGSWEPYITKSNGYAYWNGSGWIFKNESYVSLTDLAGYIPWVDHYPVSSQTSKRDTVNTKDLTANRLVVDATGQPIDGVEISTTTIPDSPLVDINLPIGTGLFVRTHNGNATYFRSDTGDAFYAVNNNKYGSAGKFFGNVIYHWGQILYHKPLYMFAPSADDTIDLFPILALGADTIVHDTNGIDLGCTGLTIYAISDSTRWQHQNEYDSAGNVIGCKWVDISKAQVYAPLSDTSLLKIVQHRIIPKVNDSVVIGNKLNYDVLHVIGNGNFENDSAVALNTFSCSNTALVATTCNGLAIEAQGNVKCDDSVGIGTRPLNASLDIIGNEYVNAGSVTGITSNTTTGNAFYGYASSTGEGGTFISVNNYGLEGQSVNSTGGYIHSVNGEGLDCSSNFNYALHVGGRTKLDTVFSGGNSMLTWDSIGHQVYRKPIPTATNYWDINGNSNTTRASNFIGTTDTIPLIFRFNNKFSGIIDSVYRFTAFGYRAGEVNRGIRCAAFGSLALENNIDAPYNTAMGDASLLHAIHNGYNTAVGQAAISNNNSGVQNVAVGEDAMQQGSTGNYNTAIGSKALNNNTADYNTSVGQMSMFHITSGGQNTGIGWGALGNNSTGTGNVAIGLMAGYKELGSNKLIIHNTYGGRDTALIYGVFPNSLLQLNADTVQPRKYLKLKYDNTSATIADSCLERNLTTGIPEMRKLPTSFSTVSDSLLLSTYQHTINGSSSGSVVWSMPFQGSSYKKAVVYFNAMNDAGCTFNYPTAFAHTPNIYGSSSCTAVTSTNTTTLTITATAGVTGFLFIEGF